MRIAARIESGRNGHDPLPAFLVFPVVYWNVEGDELSREGIRARDLSSAIAIAGNRSKRHREATGFHVGRGQR